MNLWQVRCDGVQNQSHWEKPHLGHLKAYGCKAFVKVPSELMARHKHDFKLGPRAQIGYLIGYKASNIYVIWVPHRGHRTVQARDATFNEHSFFDPSSLPTQPQIKELEEILDLVTPDDTAPVDQETRQFVWNFDLEATDPPPQQLPQDQRTMQQVLADLQADDSLSTITTESLSIKGYETSDTSVYATDPDDFSDVFGFHDNNPIRGCFFAGRNLNKPRLDEAVRKADAQIDEAECKGDKAGPIYLAIEQPLAPKTRIEMLKHKFSAQFIQAEIEHLETHQKMVCYEVVPRSQVPPGQQIIGCHWVYTYKVNKQGQITRFKARFVVQGNQEPKTLEDTYAATLAARSFRTLMAIVCKGNLSTMQLDMINAFINAPIDRVVYVRMPPGYTQPSHVLLALKAMYGLRKSPALWQKHLITTFRDLGFEAIPQEPCAMIRDDLIVWFFVDDIGIAFPEASRPNVQQLVSQLQKMYKMTGGNEIEWFLGVNIIRDRVRGKLWLSQATYVDKIFQLCDAKQLDTRVKVPMTQNELLKHNGITSAKSVTMYQKKIGSILYVAVITRPDVAFAASRLGRHNINPGEEHHRAADQVLHYLKNTRNFALEFGTTSTFDTFIRIPIDDEYVAASDASFADNTEDRKSSQGFIIMLAGGAIAWQASKQSTVTTSSTEAELLALSTTAREGIFISRLLKALRLKLDKPPRIQCDNQQTLRLLTANGMALTTKLRHVDVHNHWLRQEVQRKHIELQWVATGEMLADGLTKALPRQKFETFRKSIGVVDISSILARQKD